MQYAVHYVFAKVEAFKVILVSSGLTCELLIERGNWFSMNDRWISFFKRCISNYTLFRMQEWNLHRNKINYKQSNLFAWNLLIDLVFNLKYIIFVHCLLISRSHGVDRWEGERNSEASKK